MRVRFGFYKDAKRKALTMSYDDGKVYDLRLCEIFDKYGIKGTFHLNSGAIGKEERISYDDFPTHFKNHEISVHTVTHPHLEKVPFDEIVYEITEDRRRLESACKYPIRGMSYPYGTSNSEIIPVLKSLGMQYSRTTKATNKFELPDDFMLWHPTCHHNHDIMNKLEMFKKAGKDMPLFYLWGHSYEFPRDNNWEIIEEFCKQSSEMDDVWFATNIEIYDYIMALRALRFTSDRTIVYNPSAITVWLEVDDKPVEIPSGATVDLSLQ